MTPVMGVGEQVHGFAWQVVTGFTLGFWRGNIQSMPLRGDALSTKQSPTTQEIAHRTGARRKCRAKNMSALEMK
jgi:hypothetical protein